MYGSEVREKRGEKRREERVSVRELEEREGGGGETLWLA